MDPNDISSFPPLQLPSRSLLCLQGECKEVILFLQGLVTCDMQRLRLGTSVWGCFLDIKGRVLADAYFYLSTNVCSDDVPTSSVKVWIEVEKGSHTSLVMDLLLEMRMRRKVKIEDVSNRYAILADYKKSVTEDGSRTPANPINPYDDCLVHAVDSFKDPRSECLMGSEAALRKHIVPHEWAPAPVAQQDHTPYHCLLAIHGVGEGSAVFVSGKTLPFEGNADILAGGISFTKGCYVGQELTHRTHVMLVVRKRLMPLCIRFSEFDTSDQEASHDTLHLTSACGSALLVGSPNAKTGAVKKQAGKLTSVVIKSPKDYCATGILRVENIDPKTGLVPPMTIESNPQHNFTVQSFIPRWWPVKEIRRTFRKLKMI